MGLNYTSGPEPVQISRGLVDAGLLETQVVHGLDVDSSPVRKGPLPVAGYPSRFDCLNSYQADGLNSTPATKSHESCPL